MVILIIQYTTTSTILFIFEPVGRLWLYSSDSKTYMALTNNLPLKLSVLDHIWFNFTCDDNRLSGIYDFYLPVQFPCHFINQFHMNSTGPIHFSELFDNNRWVDTFVGQVSVYCTDQMHEQQSPCDAHILRLQMKDPAWFPWRDLCCNEQISKLISRGLITIRSYNSYYIV